MTAPKSLLTAIDLFAGAGGASEALRACGARPVAAIESDPIAARSYEMNHPGTLVVCQDIEEVDPSGLRKLLGVNKGDVDVLKACPPCQGFSTLGGRDDDDLRNDLVGEIFRFVREFQPRGVVVENVPGLRRNQRIHRLTRQLRGAGYGVSSGVLDAADFGVAQRRRRFVLLAAKSVSGKELAMPDPLSTPSRTAGEALLELENLDLSNDPLNVSRRLRPKTLARVKAIPPGGSRFDLPDELQLECHSRSSRRYATNVYGRIDACAPAPTMTTRCTTPACGRFIHPTRDRGLTLREASTLQGFPPSYQFFGGYDQIERQIGNALPVGLGIAAVSHLLRALPNRD